MNLNILIILFLCGKEVYVRMRFQNELVYQVLIECKLFLIVFDRISYLISNEYYHKMVRFG